MNKPFCQKTKMYSRMVALLLVLLLTTTSFLPHLMDGALSDSTNDIYFVQDMYGNDIYESGSYTASSYPTAFDENYGAQYQESDIDPLTIEPEYEPGHNDSDNYYNESNQENEHDDNDYGADTPPSDIHQPPQDDESDNTNQAICDCVTCECNTYANCGCVQPETEDACNCTICDCDDYSSCGCMTKADENETDPEEESGFCVCDICECDGSVYGDCVCVPYQMPEDELCCIACPCDDGEPSCDCDDECVQDGYNYCDCPQYIGIVQLVNIFAAPFTVTAGMTAFIAGPINGTITVASGGILHLNANHTITGTVNVNAGGRFYMSDGAITGTGSRGVHVSGTNAFMSMTGGRIHGNGATSLDGGGIHVTTNGRLEMSGGVVENNNARYGGGINLEGTTPTGVISGNARVRGNTAHAATSSGSGGGINSNSTSRLYIYGGYIYDNTAANNSGGGIHFGSTSRGFIRGGVITNNRTTSNTGAMSGNTRHGGGISVSSNSIVIMTDGEISHNTAHNGGGGGVNIQSNGRFELEGGRIYSNRSGTLTPHAQNPLHISTIIANSEGGGVYLRSDGARFVMRGGHIDNNWAHSGAGVAVRNTTADGVYGFTMTGGYIENNSSATGIGIVGAPVRSQNRGGGVALFNGARFSMTGGEIRYNITYGAEASDTGGNGVWLGDTARFSMGGTAQIRNNGAILGWASTVGGVYVVSSAQFHMFGNATIHGNITIPVSGGGLRVSNNAQAFMAGSASIHNNRASNQGGGVVVQNNARLEMRDNSSVRDNIAGVPNVHATNGNAGGVDMRNTAVLSMFDNAHITGNIAQQHGGGVRLGNQAQLNMHNSSRIDDNRTGHACFCDNPDFIAVAWAQTPAMPTSLGCGGTLITVAAGAQRHGGGVQVIGTGRYLVGGAITSTGTAEQRQARLNINDNASISHNRATGMGGGINLDAAGIFMHMNDGNISHNRAVTHGGGVSIFNGATFVMDDGYIEDNRSRYGTPEAAEGNGGGVAVINANSSFTMNGGSVVLNNALGGAGANGGGVSVMGSGSAGAWNAAYFNMNGGIIERNHSNAGGGVFLASGGNFIMDNNAELYRNIGRTHNGGVRLLSESSFTMENGLIHHNEAQGTGAWQFGGGVGVTGNGTFIMNNGIIEHNQARHGAGVAIEYTSVAELLHNTNGQLNGGVIRNNGHIRGQYGGGVFLLGHVWVNINGTNVINNRATSGGGGIAIHSIFNPFVDNNTSGIVRLANGRITGNQAPFGGGIWISHPSTIRPENPEGLSLLMTGGQIYNNTATTNGGGLWMNDRTLATIMSGVIGHTDPLLGNRAARGGGIDVNNGAELLFGEAEIPDNLETQALTVTRSGAPPVVINNQATNGAGIHLYGEDTTLELSIGQVMNNTATAQGGGIRVFNGAHLTITGTAQVFDNRAASGGGVAVNGAYSTFDIDSGIVGHENRAYGNRTTSGSAGGVLLAAGATMTLDGTGRIAGNTAVSGSGGIHVGTGCTLHAYSGRVDNNQAVNGGGIYFAAGSFGHIGNPDGTGTNNDIIIEHNRAQHATTANGNGGGVTVSGSVINMHNGTIRNNTATNRGGAVRIAHGLGTEGLGHFHSHLILHDGLIYGNRALGANMHAPTAPGEGGAISINLTTVAPPATGPVGNSTLTMHGGHIFYNHVTGAGNNGGNGGAVHMFGGGASFNMHGGTIGGEDYTYGNTATLNGGGVWAGGGATFTMNTAVAPASTHHSGLISRSAAAALALNATPPTISNNRATSTSPVGSGGGVFVTNPNTTFTMHIGTIDGNLSAQHGGGVAVNDSALFTMYGGTISNNEQLATGNGDGGGGVNIQSAALQTTPSRFRMYGGQIIDNEGIFGGGLRVGGPNSTAYITQATQTIETLIYNNTARSSGGGIHMHTGASVEMTGGTIENNQATNSGGGVQIGLASFEISDDVTIYNNTAGGTGGGVNMVRGYINTFAMTGGIIDDNTATFGGGVFAGYATTTPSTFTATGGEIINNHATQDGGGIFTENYHYERSVPTNFYANIGVASAVIMSGNTAGNGSSRPPLNWADFESRATRPLLGNNRVAGSTASSVHSPSTSYHAVHLLNNYDINYRSPLVITFEAESGGTFAECETIVPPAICPLLRQYADSGETIADEITIPTPVADDDYRFVGWISVHYEYDEDESEWVRVYNYYVDNEDIRGILTDSEITRDIHFIARFVRQREISYEFTGSLPPNHADLLPTTPRTVDQGSTQSATAVDITGATNTSIVNGAVTVTGINNSGIQGTWTLAPWETDDLTPGCDRDPDCIDDNTDPEYCECCECAPDDFIMPARDVHFTGNWTFTPDEFDITYSFTNYNNLPAAIRDLLPDNRTDIPAGTPNLSPTTLTSYVIEEDRYIPGTGGEPGVTRRVRWTFSGWSQTGIGCLPSQDCNSTAAGACDYCPSNGSSDNNDANDNGTPPSCTCEHCDTCICCSCTIENFRMPNRDVHFTGAWEYEIIEFEITYEFTGDGPSDITPPPSRTAVAGDAEGATPIVPDVVPGFRSGVPGTWVFNGWTTSSNLGTCLQDAYNCATISNPDADCECCICDTSSFYMPYNDVHFVGTWRWYYGPPPMGATDSNTGAIAIALSLAGIGVTGAITAVARRRRRVGVVE